MALSAAETIVDNQGFNGLSARKITDNIGYTVGTLYLVFENLDDLILQVNARTLTALFLHLNDACNNCRQPNTRITAIGRAYVDFATRHPARWQMIFDHRLPAEEQVPVWFQNKIDEMFELIEKQLQPLLERQSKRKVKHVARTLWCGVHGICALAVTNKLEESDVGSIQTLTDSLIHYFLSGLQQEISEG